MENTFENEQIFINQLPDFEQLEYQPLEKDYKKVIYLSRAIFWLILVIACSVGLYFWQEIQPYWYYVVAFLLLWAFFSFGFVEKIYKTKSFALRSHDLIFKSGWIVLETTLIPFNRVQHVEIQEGPLMRIFNLATIEIFTAGGSMSDLKISGLKKEEAEKMKAFITNKITDEADFEAEESDFLTQNSSIDAPQEQS